ncbi:phage tail tape measure protein [Clostridium thermobutyricum]|uniref:phage tail tape measure protein n=1 Tax=Clostridium thermobutyricum TaxID=29372 RepID=UPI0018AB4EC8|nr:phage tail tape measure protein [Clostridium thermobutyricum]
MSDLEKRITAKMVLDDSGYSSTLRGVNSELKNTKSEFKAASSGLEAFGRTTQNVERVQAALQRQIELQSRKIAVYKENIEKANTTLNKNVSEREKLNKAIQKEESNLEKLKKTYGKNNQAVTDSEKKLKELKEQYNKVDSSIENNAKRIQGYQTTLKNAEADLNRTVVANKRFNDSLRREGGLSEASRKLKKTGEDIQKLGSKFDSAANSMMKVAMPLGIAGIASIKASMDFGTSVSKMSTIADESEEPISKLREQVLNLSTQTGISAKDIANDAYDAMSAGQKTADSVGFVKKATDLATAGFATSAQTIDVLTSIYNAYGQTVDDVTKDSDILIATQNIGKTTVGQLSQNIGLLIPVAKESGVQLNQVGAGLALMTKQGIQTSEAITNYKAMLSELNKTGSKSDKILKKLTGEGFEGLIKKGKTVSDVLNILQGYAKKNNVKLGDMFGNIRSVTGALALASNGGKDFNDILKQMNNSSGSTEKAFEKMSNTSEYKLRVSINKLKNDGIKLGTALEPIVTRGIDIVSNFADALNKLTPGQLKLIGDLALGFIGLTAATKGLGVATNGVGGLVKMVGKFKALKAAETATDFAKTLFSVGGAAEVAGATTAGAGAAVTGFGATVAGLALPITAGVAAVAGLGYAGYKTAEYLNSSATPAVDLFADKAVYSSQQITTAHGVMTAQVQTDTIKISESTKNAVGAYLSLDKKASDSLMDLRMNSDKFTNEAKNKVIKNFTDMSKKSSNLSEEQRNNMVVDFQKLVSDTGVLTEKNKNEIISKYTQMVNATKGLTDKQRKETIKNFTDTLNQSVALTKNQSTQMQKLYKEMGDKIKAGNDKKRDEELNSQKAFFAKSNVLSSKEEADILKKTTDFWNKKKDNVNDIQNKITEIIKKAADQHRQITNDEAKTIEDLQNKMKEQAVKTLSENEVQSKVILERMSDNSKNITAQMASDRIKQLNKLRDDSINAANQECDKRIAEIIRMRDESKVISADQADKLIADAKRQRDETVHAAEETRNQAVDKITNMNSSIKSNVDTTTGDILSRWQKLANWWDNWHPIKKSFEVLGNALSQTANSMPHNWTGNSHFKGGFTTLHERGEELYDLPSGTRIYNHEMSEQMVLETAKQTAQGLIDSIINNKDFNNTNDINLNLSVNLDGNVIANVTDKINGKKQRLERRMSGGRI